MPAFGVDTDASVKDVLGRAEAAYQAKNYDAARPLMAFLAACGSPTGCFYLARMYEVGRGVAVCEPLAAELYTRAGDGGIPQAHVNLAWMHLDGRGVNKDPAAAISLFVKAAKGRHYGAADALSLLHARGEYGIRVDRVVAFAWSTVAGKLKSPDAPRISKALASSLSAHDLSVAAAYAWLLVTKSATV